MANSQATQEYVPQFNSQATQELHNSQNPLHVFGTSQELPKGSEANNRAAGQSLTPGANLKHEANSRKAEFRRQNLLRMSGVAPPQNFFRRVSRPRALTPEEAHQILLNRRAYNAQFPSARPFLAPAPAPAPAPKTKSLRKKTQGFTTSWSSPFRSVGHKNPNMNNKPNGHTKKAKSF